MIRVVLPPHLRTLARVDGEVELDVEGTLTSRSVVDTLEACYPMLRGTIRDRVTKQRRPFVRFFACERRLGVQGFREGCPVRISVPPAYRCVVRRVGADGAQSSIRPTQRRGSGVGLFGLESVGSERSSSGAVHVPQEANHSGVVLRFFHSWTLFLDLGTKRAL